MRRGQKRLTVAILISLLLVVVLMSLSHLLSEISFAQVSQAIASISTMQLLLAAAFTGASYLSMSLYDYQGLKVIGKPLRWRTAATATTLSYALSNTLGFAALTGAAARFRVYSAKGLDALDVARVIAIAMGSFWAAVTLSSGIALIIQTQGLKLGAINLTHTLCWVIGWAMLGLILVLLGLIAKNHGRVKLFRWYFELPSYKQALGLIGAACLDIGFCSAALYVLMPEGSMPSYAVFFALFSLAIVLSLLSLIPGGVGVFETMMLLSVDAPKAQVLASLLAFRVIYYLLPLTVASIWLGVREGRALRGLMTKRVNPKIVAAAQATQSFAPMMLGVLVFLTGGVLLVSGSLPPEASRLMELDGVLPSVVINLSHISASLVGTALLILAHGLYQRLKSAYRFSMFLLALGAVFSMFKGLDYEEALVCVSMAGLLYWTKAAFYRQNRLIPQVVTPLWLLLVSMVLICCVWLGFFAHQNALYRQTQWWSFALHSDAPRFLRASVAAAVLIAVFAALRLTRMNPGLQVPQQVRADEVAAILRKATTTDAMLALTGDKLFLLSEAKDALIMYQIKGRSYVVMGDPVGNPKSFSELVWAIRDLSDLAGARLVFYQLSAAVLPLAVELGFEIIKYGEEARVRLADFTLEGKRMSSLRQAHNRAIRDGLRFEMIPPDELGHYLPELKQVSDDWLRAKNQKEKRFSLGWFDAGYLRHFSIAAVFKPGDEGSPEQIVAFANIWQTADLQEMSIDLMRHRQIAPPGSMDFMFCELMLHAKQQGFEWFTLGIAPLSGIEARRLAPLWARTLNLIFTHGESMYGFKGLRNYKQKYQPQWQGRFLAAPRGLSWALALKDVQSLISFEAELPSNVLPADKNKSEKNLR